MKKRAKWIMLIIIVLVIGGILAAIFLRPQKQPQYSVEKAARGDLKQTVSINGAVKPQKSLELSFENAGVVKKVNVKVGDEVKAGQPLVQLDNREEALRLEQVQASLNLAKSNLAMAQTNDLLAAETTYNEAHQSYLNLKEKNKRDLREGEVSLEEAENYTRDYQEYFNDIEKDYEDGDITLTLRDLARTNLTNIQAQERKAREALATLELTAKQAEDQTWYRKEQAREALERQKALAQNWEKSNLLHQVDYDRIALELAQLQVTKNSFVSPIAGIVSKINIEEGEVASAFSPVMTLIAREREIEAEVPESDINAVKAGQECEITLDAASDQTFNGQVASIEPAETIIEGVTYYKIKINFQDLGRLTRSGMSADINIKILEKGDVLSVPLRAVKEKDGKKYVEIQEGEDKPNKQIFVQTGLKGDGGRVEILEGLKEGDEVITFVKQ